MGAGSIYTPGDTGGSPNAVNVYTQSHRLVLVGATGNHKCGTLPHYLVVEVQAVGSVSTLTR